MVAKKKYNLRKRKTKKQVGSGIFRGILRQRGTKKGGKKKKQRGGMFGAGMALGMGLPLITNTLGKILRINV